MDDPTAARGAVPGVPGWPRTLVLWKLGALFLTAAGLADMLFNWVLMRALGRPSDFWFIATATVPSWLTLAALLPVIFLMAERFPFYQRPFGRTALVHLAAGTGLAVVHLVVAVVVSDVLLSTRAVEVGFVYALGRGFSNYLVFDVLVYAGSWAPGTPRTTSNATTSRPRRPRACRSSWPGPRCRRSACSSIPTSSSTR